MKALSIRFKITFWFTAALILVVLFTYIAVLSVSDQIIQKGIRDNLIEAVEHNVDEIEFYTNLDGVYGSGELDHFIEYNGGYLEVDDDFLEEVNHVYTGLCYGDARLLYGENPIPAETAEFELVDAKIQKITVDGTLYYIFDRKLATDGLEGLWLRGIVSEMQGEIQMAVITKVSLVILPSLVLLAVIGGYLIAKRMLRPIQQIAETAQHIGTENDLKQRIEMGRGRDELHQLADCFNDMFEKLDNAFQAQRSFISDASHELRTPMSVIAAQCEYSLEQSRRCEEYQEALTVIRRQSDKMSNFINGMLDFTRLESDPERYLREPVNLTELTESVCSDMALIHERGITLLCEAEPGVQFTGNRQLLSQLLTNLISNAYRYGKENGHIWIQLIKDKKEIRLSVKDDGIGIAAEERQKIFQRFYQSDSSRTNAGLGLGLSMVYEIVRFHGGEIGVESTLGEGSTFTLVLSC